jgi:hypothetical protein
MLPKNYKLPQEDLALLIAEVIPGLEKLKMGKRRVRPPIMLLRHLFKNKNQMCYVSKKLKRKVMATWLT